MQRLKTWTIVGSLAVGVTVAPLWSTPATAATRGSVLTAAAGFARSQGFHVGIAVYDTKTNRTYGSGDDTGPFASESVVKAMIATRLLVQGRMSGTTARLAWKMITQSDDGIASSFYGSVGGDGLIHWIKQRYHVWNLGTRPSSPGYWGNTHITARGLVAYYVRMKRDPRVGPWLLRAMHHARPYGSDGTYQFFGLPSATSGAAVKQGWGCDFGAGCDTADFNTTGFVNHDRYAVAILARGPASTYGATIGSMLTHTARILLPGGHFPDPRPTVRELTRTTGDVRGGQRIGVFGSDFTGVRAVLFGKVRGTAVRVLGPHRLRVTAPAHAPGRVPIRVVTSHGSSGAGSVRFVFGNAAQISAVTPAVGPADGETRVQITGRHLGRATHVLFGGVPGTKLRVTSATSLSVTAPQHGPGGVDVRVINPFGRSSVSAADRFQFAGVPVITGVLPDTGPMAGGTQVTITGKHLASVTKVLFGDAPATGLVNVSSTSLTVIAPPHQSGPATIVASGPGGTSAPGPAAVFTYE
jgi:hypothetical protein